MSDELIVGGAERISVLVSSLVEQSIQFEILRRAIEVFKADLAAVDRIIGPGILSAADAPRSAMLAEREIDSVLGLLSKTAEDCELLSWGLRNAAAAYELVELEIGRFWQEFMGQAAYLLGFAVPELAVLMGPLWGGVAGAAVAYMLLTDEQKNELAVRAKAWLLENNSLLSNPTFVDAVRRTAMSGDDFLSGFLRVPSAEASLIGDRGIGLTGIDTTVAAGVVTASAVGILSRTGVSVVTAQTGIKSSPVSGVEQRVERVPEGPEQVRIDRYVLPDGSESFEVYIAGTAELSTSASDEPWDMTSNLVAVGNGSSASYRAVEEAMELAGIDSHSKVVLTGYSQGGLLAAQLAASGKYEISGLITIGAPAGQVAVPHEIPYLAIEHTNDLVPALGGDFASSEPLLVRRQIFDGEPPHGEVVLPAHDIDRYQDTARLIDASNDPRVQALIEKLAAPEAAAVSTSYYLAKRS